MSRCALCKANATRRAQRRAPFRDGPRSHAIFGPVPTRVHWKGGSHPKREGRTSLQAALPSGLACIVHQAAMVMTQYERVPSTVFVSRALGSNDASPNLESRGDSGCYAAAPPPRFLRLASPDSAALSRAHGLFSDGGASSDAWLSNAFADVSEHELVRPRYTARATSAGRCGEMPALRGAARARARSRARAAPHHVWHTSLTGPRSLRTAPPPAAPRAQGPRAPATRCAAAPA